MVKEKSLRQFEVFIIISKLFYVIFYVKDAILLFLLLKT